MYVQCMLKYFHFIMLFHTIFGKKKNHIFFKEKSNCSTDEDAILHVSCLKTRPSVRACQNSAFLNTSFVLGTLWITSSWGPRDSFNEVIVFFSVTDK